MIVNMGQSAVEQIRQVWRRDSCLLEHNDSPVKTEVSVLCLLSTLTALDLSRVVNTIHSLTNKKMISREMHIGLTSFEWRIRPQSRFPKPCSVLKRWTTNCTQRHPWKACLAVHLGKSVNCQSACVIIVIVFTTTGCHSSSKTKLLELPVFALEK